MAKFFIEHPVFACVISIIIALVGSISAVSLPVAQYPQISNPRISVSTNYVGANAEVVEQTVAQAIEKEVNGVDNMVDMRSTSDNDGNYTLDIKFDLGTDDDMDMVKVQNRVAQANASLPSEVTSYGVTTSKQAEETIMYFSLLSPNGTYDELFLKNYGTTQFVDALKRVDGVSEVNEYGPDLSLRVWLDPMKMAQNGLTAADQVGHYQPEHSGTGWFHRGPSYRKRSGIPVFRPSAGPTQDGRGIWQYCSKKQQWTAAPSA